MFCEFVPYNLYLLTFYVQNFSFALLAAQVIEDIYSSVIQGCQNVYNYETDCCSYSVFCSNAIHH